MGTYLESLDKAMKVNDTGLLAGIIHYDLEQQRFFNTVLGMGCRMLRARSPTTTSTRTATTSTTCCPSA